MTALRWILATLLGVTSFLSIVIVPVALFVAARRFARRGERRNVSGVWIVGSVAGALAVLVAPLDQRRWTLFVAPLALELAVFLLLTIVWHASGLAALEERNERGGPGPDAR
jgi:hypothetical protein